MGGVVEYRMCWATARLQGLQTKDIHGFVRMVPMADMEIARLQQEEGFAYRNKRCQKVARAESRLTESLEQGCAPQHRR